jgi:ketosteroid isomerase-like protein
VSPTGRKLNADFAAVVRVRDGKISYLRHYFDVMELMVQLGLVGAPATA